MVGDIDNDGDPTSSCAITARTCSISTTATERFEDISKRAGIDRAGWSTSGAFLDYDNDGDLDLYVANYGRGSFPTTIVFCGGSKAAGSTRSGQGPDLLLAQDRSTPARHILYRNNGDRTFTDVTESGRCGPRPTAAAWESSRPT